jgi:hypothetical protein
VIKRKLETKVVEGKITRKTFAKKLRIVKSKVIISKRTYIVKKTKLIREVREGTITTTQFKKTIKKLKVRRAKVIKISKKTFTKKVKILKEKVEKKKITVKKYKRIVYEYRSKMTISTSSYETRMRELTMQRKSSKITIEEYESKRRLLKRRLQTTVKV